MQPTAVDALPFVMPTSSTFFNSPKKINAHYFWTFPLQEDNVAANVDYFNRNFLVPGGEANKYLAQGGYCRQRPLQVPVSVLASWVLDNQKREVAMALSRGITGFFVDILDLTKALSTTGPLQSLMQAAMTVDNRFDVFPMLDMNSLMGGTVPLVPTDIIKLMQVLSPYFNLGRLPDGRIVLPVYDANLQSETWWQGVLTLLNDNGIYVALIPILQGAPNDAGAYNPISYAVGDWGTGTPGSAAATQSCIATAKAAGLEYVMSILTQQYRPKDSKFWEAQNSATLRASWLSAINGNCNWVQYITWSDYSESGQIQPCTDATLDGRIANGFHDLGAYYAAWYATGVQPIINQDVLFFFYRKAGSAIAHLNQSTPVLIQTGETEVNNVEMVAFLTQPGIVTIALGGAVNSFPGVTGPNVFTVPSRAGTPNFSLSRNGSKVFGADCPVQIYGPEGLPSGVQDMTYWSGSITRKGVTSYVNT
jgi:hypothetical protein